MHRALVVVLAALLTGLGVLAGLGVAVGAGAPIPAAADAGAHQVRAALGGSLAGAALALLLMLLLVVRRTRHPDVLVDDVVPVDPMPGVRVFDLPDSGTPLDVTDSLFEPRAVRDARELSEVEPVPGD